MLFAVLVGHYLFAKICYELPGALYKLGSMIGTQAKRITLSIKPTGFCTRFKINRFKVWFAVPFRKSLLTNLA